MTRACVNVCVFDTRACVGGEGCAWLSPCAASPRTRQVLLDRLRLAVSEGAEGFGFG